MDEQQNEMTKQTVQTEQPAQPVQAAQEQKQSVKKSRKGAMTAIFISAIVLLSLQVVLMALYLSGIVTLFGESMDLIMLLEIIEDLIRFNKASAYYILTGFAFAIVYTVMFVLMVRSFVESVKNCKYLKKKTPAYGKVALSEFSEQLSEMFFIYTFISIVTASLIGETHLSSAAIAMLVLIPLAQIFEYTVERFTAEKRPPVAEVCFTVGKTALTYTVFCLLIVFMRMPVFQDFIRGAVILFNGNITFGNGFFAFLQLFYIHIVSPILYIIMLAFVHRIIMTALLDPPEIRKRDLGAEIKRAVVFTGVLLGLQFLLGAFLANVLKGLSWDVFKNWFLLVRESHLPVFVLLVGYMLLNNLWNDDPVPAKTVRPIAASH